MKVVEISKVVEWANSDIKTLQYEAKKTPKQKEVELLGKNHFYYDLLSFFVCRDAEQVKEYNE